jgi:hypothetical protein
VLTLNYDLIVDQLSGLRDAGARGERLQKLGVLLSDTPFLSPTPPSLTKKETTGGFYLKLHGSINWLVCSNGNVHTPTTFMSLGNNLKKASAQERRAVFVGMR